MNKKNCCFKKILCCLGRNKSKQVAVIPMRGVIGNIGPRKSGISFDGMYELIDKAFENKKLSAVAIVINSPGGSPVQSEMIFKYLTAIKKEKDLPLWIFLEDIAASGGYYIACAGDLGRIIAAENSIIGSIGVISAGFGFVDLIKKIGIDRRVYTQGESKSILDPFLPEKQADIDMLKEMQEDVHHNFMNVVKNARGEKLNQDYNLFNGKVWSGIKAKELGLVDRIGYLHEVLKEEYGTDVKLIKIEAKKSRILSKLGLDVFTDNILVKIKEQLSWAKFGL